jgi:NAD(P)H-hydrate repair Nnr-like enzyme with NAD(P)H-hydrate dehydratase domain
MSQDYWTRQTEDEPLFPHILWSRPESKTGAGRLAIIGGNSFAIGAPGLAYNEADQSGAGMIRVVMPASVKKNVSVLLPDADFAPSNPSGSFSKAALAVFLDTVYWSDHVLLAGDFGRNSETAVLLETFVQKYDGPLTITQDAVDYFQALPKLILNRKNTLIVLTIAQLQKLFINASIITPITYGMSMAQLIEALHELTKKYVSTIAVKHHDLIYTAHDGRVSTSKNTQETWRVLVAARASVFYMQNSEKPLESVTTSLYSGDQAE